MKMCLCRVLVLLLAIGNSWQLVDDLFSTYGVREFLSSTSSTVLTVAYNKTVTPGVTLTPTEVRHSPEVQINQDPNGHYTLAMIDTDVSGGYQWKHWLVTNIPGNGTLGRSTGQVGTLLAEYVGAGPPADSPAHRYIFLLYQQPGLLEFNQEPVLNFSATGRDKFLMKEFASKYNLSDAIAANVFLAKYDNYVPILYEQLGLAASIDVVSTKITSSCPELSASILVFTAYIVSLCI